METLLFAKNKSFSVKVKTNLVRAAAPVKTSTKSSGVLCCAEILCCNVDSDALGKSRSSKHKFKQKKNNFF